MKTIDYDFVTNEKQYDKLIDDLSVGVKQEIEEVDIGVAKIISVDGHEPPGGKQYQTAISCLYGVGYMLKMGLKFNKLSRPKGYFDYKVGGLGSLWWSTEGQFFDISNPETLRWKAYLIVPPFVDSSLFKEAVAQAKAKKPDIPYENVKLENFDEGHSIQTLHIGPYDKERPTIELMHHYMEDHGLTMHGKHNEIYISDPRRTKPEKLKTVIRLPVE